MAELEINQETNFVSLEQAITEGTKALIPYEFEYPNTDLTVEVRLKPITNPEFNNAVDTYKLNGTTVEIELLHIGLFNIDETGFDYETLQKLPAGLVLDLAMKLMDISGIDFNKLPNRSTVDNLPGF